MRPWRAAGTLWTLTRSISWMNCADNSLKCLKVFFISIGREIKIIRNVFKPLVPDLFRVFLGIIVICLPRHTRCFYRGAARSDAHVSSAVPIRPEEPFR